GMAEQQPEVQPAEDAPDRAARPPALDLRLCGLDEPTVGHARWTHRLARAAVEAEREMAHGRVAHRHAAFGQRLDEENAPSGRIHLGAELGERRAICEAEATVNALVHALHRKPV